MHLKEVAGGKTHAQLNSAAQKDPTNTQLQGQVATMFRGETLRGLLLNAYAFGKMAQIAMIAAVVSLVLGAVLLLLSLLGMLHLRRTSPEAELGVPGFHRGRLTLGATATA